MRRTENVRCVKDGELKKALSLCEETNERTRILMNKVNKSEEWMDGIRMSVDTNSANISDYNKVGRECFTNLYYAWERTNAEVRKLQVCGWLSTINPK